MYMYMLVFCRFTIAADVINLGLYSGIPLYFYYKEGDTQVYMSIHRYTLVYTGIYEYT